MKKLLALFGIVSIASAAFSAPTANEDFVVAEDARTYTNAVAAAKEYTDEATNYVWQSLDMAWIELSDNYSWRLGVEAALPGISNRIDEVVDSFTSALADATNNIASDLGMMQSSVDMLFNVTTGHDEKISALTDATNDLWQAIESIEPSTPSEPCRVAARSWNRPSAFALAYDPILAENSTTFFDISTNAFGMVWSNVTATTAKGLAAKFFFDSLDPLSAEVAPLIQSLQVTGGGVAVDNVVTVPTAGVYRVTALTPGGEARTTRAAFSALRSKTTHGSYYVADTNANRQAVNDYAAIALAGMEPVRTGTDPSGNAYTIYSTCLPRFAAREGTGQFTPFAVAPRFAATAAHYPWVDAQNVTYTVNGQTFTIKRGAPCFTLFSWAITNGFDEAELRAAAADDIEIVPLADDAQFPADACPHFATPEWIARNYGSLDNLVAWTVTQRSEYGIPAVVTGGGNELAYYWLSAGGLTPQVRPRTDLVSLIGEYNERGWWRVQVGDSGKPVWFVDQSSGTARPILISHFKYVSGGPNYCAAARVLAALCQQYNTTFKLLQ